MKKNPELKHLLFLLLVSSLCCNVGWGAEAYKVRVDPANIAPTVATRTAPVEVFGQPRMTKGHPNTYWDQEDINHYKELAKTNMELQMRLNGLKAEMDQLIAQPIVTPPPRKGPDGTWLYPGEYYPPLPGFEKDDARTIFKRHFSANSQAVAKLGMLYALTGDERYADYAKKLLLGHAVFTRVNPHDKYTMRSVIGMVSQLLEEALMMDHFAFGYDLIYNLPSWTPEERTQLHDELFYPMAAVCLYPGSPDLHPAINFASQANNRGLIGSVSVLMAGLVTEDEELVNAALYGVHTDLKRADQAGLKQFPSPKHWRAATKDNPARGLLTCHYSEICIPGGMWVEGTPGYAFYALSSMVGGAEILWHHGIDLYRHKNSIFKNMFDFPLLISYPDLTCPGLNDAHRDVLYAGYAPTMYEYAYRRYREPAYLSMINNPLQRQFLATPDPKYKKSVRYLELTHIGAAPPSFMFDLDPAEGKVLPPLPSVNYPEVGFGILRTPALSGNSQQCLTLSSGPTASHGHPDKLHIDLFALGDVLMPSPGINFPYKDNFRMKKWYHTTVSHNTLVVDEQIQDWRGGNQKSTARADQLVFAPASTVGLQRAWSESVYKGVTMDRAVFMTPEYVADLFGAFSAEPHKYDLAWHIRGEVSANLQFEPMSFPEDLNGYNTLTQVGKADAGNESWSATFTRGNQVARLFLAGGANTQIIVGQSGFYVDKTTGSTNSFPTAPTILERRENLDETIYGNVLDYSGVKDGYVKSVTQEGSLEAGYGLLQVNTAKGTDLCFTAYRPGTFKVDGVETDGQQALVLRNGTEVRTLYLAGGTTLKTGDASLSRSEPGLAYVEKTETGYTVGNPSPNEATLCVTLAGLNGLQAFRVDEKGVKGAAMQVAREGSNISFLLKANSKVLFAAP